MQVECVMSLMHFSFVLSFPLLFQSTTENVSPDSDQDRDPEEMSDSDSAGNPLPRYVMYNCRHKTGVGKCFNLWATICSKI